MSDKKLSSGEDLGKKIGDVLVSVIELDRALNKHWENIKENKNFVLLMQNTIKASATYLSDINENLSQLNKEHEIYEKIKEEVAKPQKRNF